MNSARPIKVLHIIPGYGGGISSFVRSLFRSIDSSKIIMDVAGFTGYPSDFISEVEGKGGKAFQLANVRMKVLPSCIRQFREIARAGSYDAVHLHLSGKQAAYFSALASVCGIRRKIVHAHIAEVEQWTVEQRVKNAVDRKLTVASATDFASCSKLASAFRFGQRYVDTHMVMHLPNAIWEADYAADLSAKARQQYIDELKLIPGQIIIGNVGYFGYQKNHEFMFKICRALKARGISFVWLFVGNGSDFERYVDMAAGMGLSDVTRFLGRRNDVSSLFKLMDVSVLASHYEGLPTVGVESQAAGTPIVLSDTITRELDMGLNLSRFLSLSEPLDKWCDVIIELAMSRRPASSVRLGALNRRCFTTERAAALYTAYLQGSINYYDFGEPFNG